MTPGRIMNLFTEEKRWPGGLMRPTFSGFGLGTGLNQVTYDFLWLIMRLVSPLKTFCREY
jgi:hypothetical protein